MHNSYATLGLSIPVIRVIAAFIIGCVAVIIFVFIAKNWATCKTPFLRSLGCLVVYLVGMGLSFYGAMSSGMVPSTPTQ